MHIDDQILMIKLQGTDKLQNYFENSSWWVMETILKFPLLVSILNLEDISIDIEISIDDPFTNVYMSLDSSTVIGLPFVS